VTALSRALEQLADPDRVIAECTFPSRRGQVNCSFGDRRGLMDTPDDRQAAAELLAATRELVEVNRQIAQSLAGLEQLYAREVERTAAQRQKIEAMIARLGDPPGRWGFYIALLLPAAIMALVLLK
jgi:hypothetical protein